MTAYKPGRPVTFRLDADSAEALNRILALAPEDPDRRGGSVTDLMRELVVQRDKLVDARRWIRGERPDLALIPIHLTGVRLKLPSYAPGLPSDRP